MREKRLFYTVESGKHESILRENLLPARVRHNEMKKEAKYSSETLFFMHVPNRRT